MKAIKFIMLFATVAMLNAQNNSNLELEKQKLKQAYAYADNMMAVNALHSIIALEGTQSIYKDSLAFTYFDARKFISCFLVTNDILSYKSNNVQILEMNAISLESMGAVDKAAESYSKLLAQTNNNYHAYKLAGLYYTLNKTEEALVTIQKAIQLPNNETIKINFQVNKNFNQEVDLLAAIYYLEGVLNSSMEKPAKAKASFERAIQIFPDFVLAKTKLDELNSVKE